MTAQEMINNFLLEYDLNGSGAVAGFTDDEILSFLNKAQLKVVEDIFLKFGPEQIYNTNKVEKTGLVVDFDDTNLYWVSLPVDYMYPVSLEVLVTRVGIKEIPYGWIRSERIRNRNTVRFRTNSLNRLILINPVYYIMDEKLYVITDQDTTIDEETPITCNFTYIETPQDIAVLPVDEPSLLSEKWHQDIVDMAVKLAMFITSDKRLQRQTEPKR